MSLVKSNKRRSPRMGGSLMSRDPFFADFFKPSMGLMNLNKMFDNDFEKSMELPALNISEKKDKFEIELAVPGFAKEDFEVTMDEGMLTISANKEDETEEKKDSYLRREFSSQSFTRTLSLPDNVDEEKEVKASFKDGVLKLDLAKMENAPAKPSKKIKIS